MKLFIYCSYELLQAWCISMINPEQDLCFLPKISWFSNSELLHWIICDEPSELHDIRYEGDYSTPGQLTSFVK